MRAGILLVLLLSAVAIGQTEAWGWAKAAFKALSLAVKIAVNWVTNNCDNGGCSWSLRRKRDTGSLLSPQLQESEDRLCDELSEKSILLEGGFTFDLFKTVFETVDRGDSKGDGDDVLDQEEFTKFMETIEVFHYCFSREK